MSTMGRDGVMPSPGRAPVEAAIVDAGVATTVLVDGVAGGCWLRGGTAAPETATAVALVMVVLLMVVSVVAVAGAALEMSTVVSKLTLASAPGAPAGVPAAYDRAAALKSSVARPDIDTPLKLLRRRGGTGGAAVAVGVNSAADAADGVEDEKSLATCRAGVPLNAMGRP